MLRVTYSAAGTMTSAMVNSLSEALAGQTISSIAIGTFAAPAAAPDEPSKGAPPAALRYVSFLLLEEGLAE